MMRKPFAWTLVAAMIGGLGLMAHAMDEEAADEEVVVTGTMTCAMCGLGEAEACQTVLIVEEETEDEVITYILITEAENKPPKVCKNAVEGVIVTGTISEGDDGTQTLNVTEIEMPDDEA